MDVFAVCDASRAYPAGKVAHRLVEPRYVVGGQKTLHGGALDQQMPLGPWSLVPWLPSRVRRRTTNRAARTPIDVTSNGVVDRSRGVVEVGVDGIGTVFDQGGVQIAGGLVVNGGVVTEMLNALANLVRSAGNSYCATTFDLSDLADRRTHRAGGGRHSDRLPLHGMQHVEQAKVRGEPVQPQHAQR